MKIVPLEQNCSHCNVRLFQVSFVGVCCLQCGAATPHKHVVDRDADLVARRLPDEQRRTLRRQFGFAGDC